MVGSSSPLILNISSDDEDEDNLLADIGTAESDCDWISELFPEDEIENEREYENSDSDEVMVISEIVGSPKRRKKEDEDDVDDDCVILEEDPDKRVEVESDGGIDTDDLVIVGEKGKEDPDKRVEVESEGGSNLYDLVIVGEKGKIACRDYPHARHLCAKFLFASTPHEHHCNQCHCYVCDSLAPCLYWGNGSSNTDHCHSTDQDPLWKAQRQNFKQAPLLLLQPTDATLLLPPPQTIPFPISTPAQNQIARLPAIHSYSTSNSGISNLTHQRRSHPSLHTSPMDKFNPSLVSQQLLRSCNTNNNNHIIGRQTPCNLGAQHLNRPRIFKKTGSNLVALPNSRPGYGTTNNKYASQYPRNPHTLAKLSNRSSTYQQKQSVAGSHSQQNYSGSSGGSVPPSQAHVNGSNTFVNSVPFQPQAFNNQFGSGNGFENSVVSQQYSSQTNMGSTFVNPMPPPSQVIPQPNMNCFQSQFLLESYSHPNMGINNFEKALPCQSQALSQPNTGSASFINPIYSQSQTYNQPNYSQQGNETQSAMNSSSANQYSRIDSFPAQDPALSRQPAVSECGSSIVPENINIKYSYFSENDPWMGGYVGTDGFDLDPSEAVTVDTGGLFDYRDSAFD